MLDVVAAVIERDGRYLICQRPAYKTRGLLWEFPGGKVEPGETLQDAIIRECREELNILVQPTGILTEVEHVYPDLTIRLHFLLCRLLQGEPQPLEHSLLQWVRPGEAADYPFCPADAEVAALLLNPRK